MKIGDTSRLSVWKRTFLALEIVLLISLGVGGATVLGAVLGFVFKNISAKYKDATLGVAAGVMLAASVFSLVIPSLEVGGAEPPLICVLGILLGASTIDALDFFIKRLETRITVSREVCADGGHRALLFVLAIAIHNLPEGIAAGVGFGTGNTADALMIAGGIALQNIPEGMVLIAPMLSAGFRPGATFLIAAMTGGVEIIGAALGFFAVSIVTDILGFALAFAAGCMLFVILDEMIPEARESGNVRTVNYAVIVGFGSMVIFNSLF